MEIIYKNINDLEEYENNPRENESAIKYVKNSIQKFGFRNPVIIDQNNVIVCGHTRVKSAKLLGMTEVPCIMVDDLTEEEINAFRLADNKVAEFAEWDIEKLDIELAQLEFDMSDFGFDLGDVLDDNEVESVGVAEEEEQCVVVACNQEDVEATFKKLIQAGLNAFIVPVDKKLKKIIEEE